MVLVLHFDLQFPVGLEGVTHFVSGDPRAIAALWEKLLERSVFPGSANIVVTPSRQYYSADVPHKFRNLTPQLLRSSADQDGWLAISDNSDATVLAWASFDEAKNAQGAFDVFTRELQHTDFDVYMTIDGITHDTPCGLSKKRPS